MNWLRGSAGGEPARRSLRRQRDPLAGHGDEPSHVGTYARRKWRYVRGALQHQMLVRLLERDGMGAVPRHVNDLYHEGPLPSRRAWTGRDTLFGLLAVLWIRSFRRRAQRAERYTPAVR